ncbi:MAG: GNAT family N-acetyltransferase [Ilumatobacter sp.]
MPRTSEPPVEPFGADLQPAVEIHDGLVLRPFERGDVDVVRAAFNDVDIMRWHHFRIDSDDEAIEWIDQTLGNWMAGTAAHWLIESEGRGVGRICLHVDAERATGEIAYWLLPVGRGSGAATRAAHWVTNWGHGRGIHRIVLQHGATNRASCAVADRLGYAAEGVARGAEFHDGVWSDVHLHAHLSTDPLLAFD